MNKKRLFIFVISFLLIIGASVSAVALLTNKSFNLGSRWKSIHDSDKKIIAYVNDTPIYSDSLEYKKMYRDIAKEKLPQEIKKIEDLKMDPDIAKKTIDKLQKNIKSDQELLDEIIQDEIVLKQCQEQGISVSDEEAKKVGDENFELVKKALKSENTQEKISAEENWNALLQVADSLGVSMQEYQEKYAVQTYKKMLLHDKYYQKFVSTLQEETKKNSEACHAEYEKHLQEIKKDYKIKIL